MTANPIEPGEMLPDGSDTSGEPVAVKPLEWEKDRGSSLSRAETILGTYRVWTHPEANGIWFWRLKAALFQPAIPEGRVANESNGRAAAQADYEQRILSALVLPGAPK